MRERPPFALRAARAFGGMVDHGCAGVAIGERGLARRRIVKLDRVALAGDEFAVDIRADRGGTGEKWAKAASN